jgi:RNA polymerase sigma-70 factor (ECF subfamily)
MAGRGALCHGARRMEEIPGGPPDAELLARAGQGDLGAFDVLVERHRDRVYALALRITRSEADAAEVTQDTFLAAYQHLQSLRGEAAFSSWLRRIAANNALMRLRRRKVASSAEEELRSPELHARGTWTEHPQGDWSRRADERALDAELGRAIQDAIDKLPEPYRQVVILRDFDDCSYEEIGEITGDSVAAIKSRLHRARLALRDAIDRFYNGP